MFDESCFHMYSSGYYLLQLTMHHSKCFRFAYTKTQSPGYASPITSIVNSDNMFMYSTETTNFVYGFEFSILSICAVRNVETLMFKQT